MSLMLRRPFPASLSQYLTGVLQNPHHLRYSPLNPQVYGHIQLTQDPNLEVLEVDYHLLEAKSILT